MKNIHILPTDKPSRLYSYKSNLFLTTESHLHSPSMEYQNLYITNDEEIKTGDWYKTGKFIWQMKYHQWGEEGQGDAKKIILTTDQDLIKDGVQAINDEFLEWFVKNPSCEEVIVLKKSRCCGRCNGVDDLCYTDIRCDDHHVYGCETCYGKRVEYSIIIPKVKPKKVLTEEDIFNQRDIDAINTYIKIDQLVDEEAKKIQKQHLIDMMKGDEELGLYEQTKCYCGHTITCECGPEELKEDCK